MASNAIRYAGTLILLSPPAYDFIALDMVGFNASYKDLASLGLLYVCHLTAMSLISDMSVDLLLFIDFVMSICLSIF